MVENLSQNNYSVSSLSGEWADRPEGEELINLCSEAEGLRVTPEFYEELAGELEWRFGLPVIGVEGMHSVQRRVTKLAEYVAAIDGLIAAGQHSGVVNSVLGGVKIEFGGLINLSHKILGHEHNPFDIAARLIEKIPGLKLNNGHPITGITLAENVSDEDKARGIVSITDLRALIADEEILGGAAIGIDALRHAASLIGVLVQMYSGEKQHRDTPINEEEALILRSYQRDGQRRERAWLIIYRMHTDIAGLDFLTKVMCVLEATQETSKTGKLVPAHAVMLRHIAQKARGIHGNALENILNTIISSHLGRGGNH